MRLHQNTGHRTLYPIRLHQKKENPVPRQVDHASRRRQIADAVFLLAGERGLEGVTLRDVAARASVSMGAVQRCFRTKEEMLVFALSQLTERVSARVSTRTAASPAQSARSLLGHTLAEVALADDERRAEARVWLAFVAQAAVTPSLADVLRSDYTALHSVLVRLFKEALGTGSAGELADEQHGEEHGEEEAQMEAHTVLALVDGLTVHVLTGQLDAGGALAVLDRHLDGLWERSDAQGL